MVQAGDVENARRACNARGGPQLSGSPHRSPFPIRVPGTGIWALHQVAEFVRGQWVAEPEDGHSPAVSVWLAGGDGRESGDGPTEAGHPERHLDHLARPGRGTQPDSEAIYVQVDQI